MFVYLNLNCEFFYRIYQFVSNKTCEKINFSFLFTKAFIRTHKRNFKAYSRLDMCRQYVFATHAVFTVLTNQTSHTQQKLSKQRTQPLFCGVVLVALQVLDLQRVLHADPSTSDSSQQAQTSSSKVSLRHFRTCLAPLTNHFFYCSLCISVPRRDVFSLETLRYNWFVTIHRFTTE